MAATLAVFAATTAGSAANAARAAWIAASNVALSADDLGLAMKAAIAALTDARCCACAAAVADL